LTSEAGEHYDPFLVHSLHLGAGSNGSMIRGCAGLDRSPHAEREESREDLREKVLAGGFPEPER
jgi:hypothetical protein